MPIELALIGAVVVIACALWAGFATVHRRLANAGWIVAILLFMHEFAFVAGTRTGLLISSVIGPVVLVFVLALPAVLRSPRNLLRAASEQGVWLWIALLAYGALSLSWSRNREYGAQKLLVASAIGLAPGLAMYLTYRYCRRISWNGVLALGALYAAVVLSQGMMESGRLTAQDSNPIWVARSALLVVTIAIWDSHSWLPLRITSAVLGLWVALVAQSRGPLLAFLAAPMVIAAMFLMRRKRVRYRRASVAVVATGITVLLSLLVILPSVPLDALDPDSRLASLIHLSQMTEDVSVVERLTLQRDAFERFASSPFFGVGVGGNAPAGDRSYPHNVPLEMASELGLVGLLLWVAAVTRGFRCARGFRLVQILLLQVVLYSLTSGDLGANNLVLVFSVFACALPATSMVPGYIGRQVSRDAHRGLLVKAECRLEI